MRPLSLSLHLTHSLCAAQVVKQVALLATEQESLRMQALYVYEQSRGAGYSVEQYGRNARSILTPAQEEGFLLQVCCVSERR